MQKNAKALLATGKKVNTNLNPIMILKNKYSENIF